MSPVWIFIILLILCYAFQILGFLLFEFRISAEFAVVQALALTYCWVEDKKFMRKISTTARSEGEENK